MARRIPELLGLVYVSGDNFAVDITNRQLLVQHDVFYSAPVVERPLSRGSVRNISAVAKQVPNLCIVLRGVLTDFLGCECGAFLLLPHGFNDSRGSMARSSRLGP